MDILINSSALASMVRISTPLTLAAIGCLLCQRAGITNLAMEGFMLMGSFVGVAAAIFSGGNVWIGMISAMVSGTLLSALFALSIVNLKANQIISGIAINLFSQGLTTFLLRTIFHVQGMISADKLEKLQPIHIPFLDYIPIIGKALNSQTLLTYVAIILIFITYFILFKTEYGLNIRSVGESDEAARTAGINPINIQWSVILISGALSGLAGAYLSTTIVSSFTINMIQGRGFNAFTAVVFGNAHPIAVWLVTLLFGYADAIGIQIELLGTKISPSVIQMFPYVLAIVALSISSGTNKYKNLRGSLNLKQMLKDVFMKSNKKETSE